MSDPTPRPANAYILVPARSLDDEQIRSFAAAVWPDRQAHDRLLSRWWRRADAACAVAAIHRETNMVAALCAGRPSEWAIAGEPHPAVAVCDWYVAPGHRGRLIGRRLVRQFEAPGRFMYAFSLSPDAVAYLARLGWAGPYTTSLMVLPLPRVVRMVQAAMPHAQGLELRDYAVDSGALPPGLAAGLNHIEAASFKDSSAHMLRGAGEWTWRLSVCRGHSYSFSVAHREAVPAGYMAVRRSAPGRSRTLGILAAALIVDLAAVDDDPLVLRALARRAVAMAAEWRAGVVAAATTAAPSRKALTALGFLSSSALLLGSILQRFAPQYMWVPKGPGANLREGGITLTFADSDVDLNL